MKSHSLNSISSIIIALLFCITGILKSENQIQGEINKEIIDSILQFSDSSLIIFQNLEQNHQDPASQFYLTLGQSRCYGEMSRFDQAFDKGWEAYQMAEDLGEPLYLAHSQSYLGVLLGYFNQQEEALEYLHNAKDLLAALFQENKITPQQIIAAYFDLAIFYHSTEEYELSYNYLDTCYSLGNKYGQSQIDKAFLDVQMASTHIATGKAELAKEVLLSHQQRFEQLPEEQLDKKRFIIFIYLAQGNLYASLGNDALAIDYYQRTIKAIEHYNYHRGTAIFAYKFLSEVQLREGRYNDAYQNLKVSADLNESYFSTRSQYNTDLIKFKNRYQELANEQRITLLQQEKRLLITKVLIIAILTILLVGFYLFYNQLQKQKMKARHEQMRFEKEQANELLKQRNRELTATTLRMIEKDDVIDGLCNELKKYAAKDKDAKMQIKMAKNGSQVSWEEFNSRFVSVNKDFYNNLEKRFPGLSPTELKHCALIKLNFSSKEMAQLLGISLTGVNVARYRLRKKFGLTREVNLTKFMAEF